MGEAVSEDSVRKGRRLQLTIDWVTLTLRPPYTRPDLTLPLQPGHLLLALDLLIEQASRIPILRFEPVPRCPIIAAGHARADVAAAFPAAVERSWAGYRFDGSSPVLEVDPFGAEGTVDVQARRVQRLDLHGKGVVTRRRGREGEGPRARRSC